MHQPQLTLSTDNADDVAVNDGDDDDDDEVDLTITGEYLCILCQC